MARTTTQVSKYLRILNDKVLDRSHTEFYADINRGTIPAEAWCRFTYDVFPHRRSGRNMQIDLKNQEVHARIRTRTLRYMARSYSLSYRRCQHAVISTCIKGKLLQKYTPIGACNMGLAPLMPCPGRHPDTRTPGHSRRCGARGAICYHSPVSANWSKD